MSYVDGFIIPAREAERDRFIDHATRMDQIFIDMGAPCGSSNAGPTMCRRARSPISTAVALKEGEKVVSSWIEWPDKETRDAAMARMREDARLMAEPMPFDGQRMIFGGFTPVVSLER